MAADEKPPRGPAADGPGPRLVVWNTDNERAQESAVADVEVALRDLAANVLRVVRGAGKPHDIGRQCMRLVSAYERHSEVFNHYPSSHVIGRVLETREDIDWEKYPEQAERHEAVEIIIRGALQVSASRLAGQRTQEAAGDTEIHDGLRMYERWRAEVIAKREAEKKAAAAAARAVAKPKKRVLKPRKTDGSWR